LVEGKTEIEREDQGDGSKDELAAPGSGMFAESFQHAVS
jgi:hypothetical protein